MRLKGAALVFGLLAQAPSSAARAQQGDVWLHQESGALSLGVVDEAGVTYTPNIRALQVILTPDSLPFSPFDYSAEDPGFRAAADELPPNQTVNLALISLQKWNGAGLEPASGVSFAFDLSSGFATEANGGMHEHPLYGLIDLTADSQPIPDSVYIAAFQVSTAGLTPSDIEYFVMLKDALVNSENDAEDLGKLLEGFENGGVAPVFNGKDFTFFEQAYRSVAVPEPARAALAVVALAALRRRQRT
jgi:hypothetical protein